MSKKQLWKSNKNSTNSKTLEELRDEAASLISINNTITSQIWTIENKLLSCTNESKEALLKQKEALADKLLTLRTERINRSYFLAPALQSD